MDFYLDANLPPRIAHALNAIEGNSGNKVFSTSEVFGQDIKDPDLIIKLQEANGILITHDIKMRTRANEYQLLKEKGITVFIISIPQGFTLIYQTIFEKWEEIKKYCEKNKMPFVCRMTRNGKPTIY